MKTVSFQVPETLLVALRKEPDEFVREMRLAAVKWYESGDISPDRAAEIAGLTRSEFINTLSLYNISFCQKSVEEIAENLSDRPRAKLSLRQIAALPIEERHRLLAQSIALTAEDFLNDPELTEFSVLDGEDWDAEMS